MLQDFQNLNLSFCNSWSPRLLSETPTYFIISDLKFLAMSISVLHFQSQKILDFCFLLTTFFIDYFSNLIITADESKLFTKMNSAWCSDLKNFLKSKFFPKLQLVFKKPDSLHSFDISHLYLWFWYFSDTTMASPAWGARVWVCSCVHRFSLKALGIFRRPNFLQPFPRNSPCRHIKMTHQKALIQQQLQHQFTGFPHNDFYQFGKVFNL